jgi:hypothetical protein
MYTILLSQQRHITAPIALDEMLASGLLDLLCFMLVESDFVTIAIKSHAVLENLPQHDPGILVEKIGLGAPSHFT